MESIGQILTAFRLDKQAIDRLTAECKEFSIDCGQHGVIKELSPASWDLLDDISNGLWGSATTNFEKIKMGFQLFELFPSYYHFLVPFYHGIRNKEIIEHTELTIIWEYFIEYLAGENYYADPVAYVLWVEFFEDDSTVEIAWRGLMNHRDNTKAVRRLLESTGPVPYDLKDELYRTVVLDTANHEPIFLSLLYSAYDVYGKIDKLRARALLKKLVIDRDSEKYKLLRKKLK